VFFCNVWRHFLKSNNVGRHFYPDFQQIKIILEVRFHPFSYTTASRYQHHDDEYYKRQCKVHRELVEQ